MRLVGGVLKEYAWGITDGLVQWSGHATAGPQAEVWFGDHPSGRSPWHGGRHDDRPNPLLVKLLAAGSTLSIQVHPDAAAIERIHAETGGMLAAGILTDGMAGSGLSMGGLAPGGMLADHAEKYETLLALGSFSLLCGLRDPREAAPLISACGLPAKLSAQAYAADQVAWITAALTTRQLDPDLDAARSAMDESDAEIFGQVADAWPQDRGLLVALVLQPYRLLAGDAISVATGVPHAYVRGLGVEVMTASDNVLRLGLTPKAVAVAQGTAALRLDRGPVLTRGAAASGTAFPADQVPAWPYSLVTLAAGRSTIAAGAARTVLPVSGDVEVEIAGEVLRATPGQAVLAAADEPDLLVATSGGGDIPAVVCRAR